MVGRSYVRIGFTSLPLVDGAADGFPIFSGIRGKGDLEYIWDNQWSATDNPLLASRKSMVSNVMKNS